MCSDWLWIKSYLTIITPHKVITNNNEELIFKVAAVRFLDVFEEAANKMKENAVVLIVT